MRLLCETRSAKRIELFGSQNWPQAAAEAALKDTELEPTMKSVTVCARPSVSVFPCKSPLAGLVGHALAGN